MWAGIGGVQYHSWLPSEFKISLNSMRPCLKKEETLDPQRKLKGFFFFFFESRFPHFLALFFKISLHVLLCIGTSRNKRFSFKDATLEY